MAAHNLPHHRFLAMSDALATGDNRLAMSILDDLISDMADVVRARPVVDELRDLRRDCELLRRETQ